MNTITKILVLLGIIVVSLAVGFGINTAIVWVVCKIMGWTFAWKWVILFTIVYALLTSLIKSAAN